MFELSSLIESVIIATEKKTEKIGIESLLGSEVKHIIRLKRKESTMYTAANIRDICKKAIISAAVDE